MSIADNIARVRERIAEATAATGRKPDSVELVAVSKTMAFPLLEQANRAGIKAFGENYLQEATEKIVDAQEAGLDCRFHFIGNLQSRKVRDVVKLFDMIHSVDTGKLVHEIEKRAGAIEKVMPVLIEVNIAAEDTKGGVGADQGFDELIDEALQCKWLSLRGLMTMPPFPVDPEDSRPYFRKLAELKERAEDIIRKNHPQAIEKFTELSMGMTGDFEVAIAEGATMVRVGTAIFGSR
jgi:PLP dependent protein